MMRMTGLVLLVIGGIGIVGLAFGGFEYTQRKEDVELGPLVVQRVERKSIDIPPLVTAAALVAGAILLAGSRRGRQENI